MAVYVDNMRRQATVGAFRARWSHMLADTHAELMDMAARLGLRAEWLQHEGTYREHFDLTEQRRTRAVALGAEQIDYPHGTGRILAEKKAAMTTEETPA